MFDDLPLQPAALRDAADDAVAAAVEGWARVEAAAGARRLAAVAELTVRSCEKEGERAYWSCDGWDFAAAEVGAALELTHGRASGQMQLAMTLRRRLPRVGALYLAGEVNYRVVSMIAWRTHLVDDDAIAEIDAAVAERAARWGRLSEPKLVDAIDSWVLEHDPAALRRTQAKARSRNVEIGQSDDTSGTTSLWGSLFSHDAALLDRRLLDMAHAVCEDDPRTIAQRRADALGALAAGSDRLVCGCGDSACPAAGPDARAAHVTVHVVADESALTATPDPAMSGADVPTEPDSTRSQRDSGRRTAECRPAPGGGVITGGGVIPTPLLAELIKNGSTVRRVSLPADVLEPRDRPSTKLQRFVRARDLTCRFPGCSVPAERCDVDHTIPYPCGPTHPSNLKCLCRKHHLLKTFWSGWREKQDPDGTIVWTSPSGREYRTRPGSKLLFPGWDTATGPLESVPTQSSGSQLTMPRRKRTRSQSRLQRIRQERALNAELVAQRNKPPPC